MVGRGVVMVPVHHGSDAAVDLIQGADQVSDIDIFRPEEHRQAGMDGAKIVGARPIATDSAQSGLPGMDMPVDQARHDDHARRIDDFGGFTGCEVGAHCDDLVVLDQEHHRSPNRQLRDPV